MELARKNPFQLAVLTTGRQDWGLLRPLVEQLVAEPDFGIHLLAGGMACSPDFGMIVVQIRKQGFSVARELAWDVDNGDPVLQSASALEHVGLALQELKVQALLLLGDRYETAAAAIAATVMQIPIVHLHGGEETEGAFDNALRHAITKMSHLHLVAHETYRKRVVQMGENPRNVHVVGSLGVDNTLRMDLPEKEDLESHLGIQLIAPVGLVTVHPTTLSCDDEDKVVDAVAGAVEMLPGTWIVTLPNADPGNQRIRSRLIELADARSRVLIVEMLGAERFLGVMKLADIVLGNSSSGMIEAPAMRVPTINVGDRQKGRIRFPSIIDVTPDVNEILDAFALAVSEPFRCRVAEMEGFPGDGRTAEMIVTALKEWRIAADPRKSFVGVC